MSGEGRGGEVVSRGVYWRRGLLIRTVSAQNLKESRVQGLLFPSVEGVVDTNTCLKTK